MLKIFVPPSNCFNTTAPLKQRVPYGPGACGRGAMIWRLKTRLQAVSELSLLTSQSANSGPRSADNSPCPQHPSWHTVARTLASGTWGCWTGLGVCGLQPIMSSIPHLAQDNKSKLQNPDGESRGPVKSGHPAPEQEQSQENACFLSAALECSSLETPGAGLPGSFLTRWPRPAQDAPHPGKILGTRLALRSQARPGGAVGHVASRAGPRLRQAGSCKLPGHCPGDTRDPDVKACMLIVRERKQDSCCSEPRSHGEFDVRV